MVYLDISQVDSIIYTRVIGHIRADIGYGLIRILPCKIYNCSLFIIYLVLITEILYNVDIFCQYIVVGFY
jgi:hypothetical protein